ncbi:hypothetical protein [Streptomyces sp. NPDC016845]|uniref:hypothetical protein n=1 Tax=Streptomyces sp. NPDC016845 TaxID=3364972 RepID=UPI003794493C
MLDRIDPAWGARFRDGGINGTRRHQPCGRDPLERLAWIAESWREQAPYTRLAFFRGQEVSAERNALLYGADPAQIAARTRLAGLCDMDGGAFDNWGVACKTCCFGRAGGWAFLMYHETPDWEPGPEALARLGVTERVHLTATSAKAVYTFDYLRDGRRVDDDWGILELIRYDRGRAPTLHTGPPGDSVTECSIHLVMDRDDKPLAVGFSEADRPELVAWRAPLR